MQPDKPTQIVLSMLSPSEVKSFGGLPGEAVLGVYAGPDESLDHFRPNRTFIDFLHRVLADLGARCPELAAAARAQGNGGQYQIDPRTPEGTDGNVPPEDIIGAFEVREGVLVPGSYWPNPEYRVLTKNGPTGFTPTQREAFVSALRERRSDAGGT
jgi:hypothetical protein